MSTHPALDQMAMLTAMSVHVFPETAVRVRLHPDEQRAVVVIGDVLGCPTVVNLFLDRAELVALRDTLAAAVTDLDTAEQTRRRVDEAVTPAA